MKNSSKRQTAERTGTISSPHKDKPEATAADELKSNSMASALKDPSPQRRDVQRNPRRAPQRRIAIWGPLLLVLAVALLLIGGIWRHFQQNRARKDFTDQNAKVSVNVVTVKHDAKPHDILLPGDITAMQETTLYARAKGYVSKWLVDIGDNVKNGQLLAEIETPELDQQLAAARDSLKQAETNVELARTTAERWEKLVSDKVVSKQENDEKQASFKAQTEGLSATKAELGRLEQLQGFKKITAPFAGKITARKIDNGSLVSEGSGNAGTVLFTIAQTDPLRVFVNVPQDEAPLIAIGNEAKLIVKELASRDFTGKVTRTSGALDPTSRTLRTEVEVPNNDGALFAGMYAEVKFTLREKAAPILIPANVFVFKPEGTQAAIVTADNKIHWQKIEVGRDFGTTMEVLKGLEDNVRVVMNPSDDLTEGLEVEARQPDEKKEGDAPKPPADDKKK
ncbi:MAG: efflux transporter, family, subunit [Verrucomicrobiaceae bacterium]|nr:efflux transporter, family, subunit [Verrucomicrobiaceae bacterium]